MIEGIKPRDYQNEILSTCKDKNCLVVLPTGIGKTLIALMLAEHRLREHPDKKVLFLAPTRPLAEQQLEYFKKYLPELFATIEIFTGKVPATTRKKLWQRADIIFSTPQCIANDVRKNLYDLSEVSLLIEDEAHRCIRNYDYAFIAKNYLSKASHPRILGMTASPGADKKKIREICNNLGIQALEVRTRDSEDVKEYLQDLKTEVIKLIFPSKLSSFRDLLKKIYDRKLGELKNRKLLFGSPTKTNLLKTQARLIQKISSGDKNFNSLIGASACAQAIKISHAMELLETQTVSSALDYLKDLLKQAEQKKSKAVQSLVKLDDFNTVYLGLTELVSQGFEHPKVKVVRDVVWEEMTSGKGKRIIVFSQFRSTASRVCKELNSLQGVNGRVFVGQAKKGDTGLSQKEQKEMLDEFRSGEVNCLCATSIGEEGLDLPEVSLVVFYEPIPSAIRKIQRRGRTARLKPGRVVTLVTKATRDEIYFWSAFHKEKKMASAMDSLKKEFDGTSEGQKGLEDFGGE